MRDGSLDFVRAEPAMSALRSLPQVLVGAAKEDLLMVDDAPDDFVRLVCISTAIEGRSGIRFAVLTCMMTMICYRAVLMRDEQNQQRRPQWWWTLQSSTFDFSAFFDLT